MPNTSITKCEVFSNSAHEIGIVPRHRLERYGRAVIDCKQKFRTEFINRVIWKVNIKKNRFLMLVIDFVMSVL